MTAKLTESYRHRLVVPDLPAPTEFFPLLEEMRGNGWYSNFGPLVRRLEGELLTAFGAPEESCVTCCNATAGLSAALLATGRTGQVLLPAFTFAASLGAIRAAGMTPVVADVDAQTWTLSGDLLDRALAETGAGVVMLVAPFGIQKNWEAELAICHKHSAAVVIDDAAGLGSPRASQGFGENVFEVFSMHATKPFAVGEGGAIFASRIHEAALRSALNFALNSNMKPEGPAWGFNGKMSEFHAAVGIVQLRRIRDIVAQHQACAAFYRDRLARYPEIVCPQNVNCAPWQVFPVLLSNGATAERFIENAAAAGVEIRRAYARAFPIGLRHDATGACPVAEDLADRFCVLPIRAVTPGPEAYPVVDLVLDALDRALCKRQ